MLKYYDFDVDDYSQDDQILARLHIYNLWNAGVISKVCRSCGGNYHAHKYREYETPLHDELYDRLCEVMGAETITEEVYVKKFFGKWVSVCIAKCSEWFVPDESFIFEGVE